MTFVALHVAVQELKLPLDPQASIFGIESWTRRLSNSWNSFVTDYGYY